MVVGNVIRRDNPEAQAVEGPDLPRLSLPEALNRFLVGDRQSLVVAGTHGKTTTTALIGLAALRHRAGPRLHGGGHRQEFRRPITGWASGRYVVLEGDEYDTAFFDKRPKFVHFHAPGGGAHLHRVRPRRHLPGPGRSHRGLRHLPVHRMPPGGRVLAWGDAPLVRQVCERSHAPVRFYGLGE